MKNYVYYFQNYEKEIIYVGKTTNIKQRIKQHFQKGHLPKECYRNVDKIFIAEIEGACNTEICETLLIDKYKPIFNSDKKYNDNIKTNFNLVNLDFKRLYINIETNEISTRRFEHTCYKNTTMENKAQNLMKYNLCFLKKRKDFLKKFCPELTDSVIKDIINIYEKLQHYIILDDSILDKSISKNNDLLDTYVVIDKDEIKKLSDIQIKNCMQYNFIFQITNDIYAIPLLRKGLFK